ncbi:hypothetical protein BANRA_00003 [Klebsiella pneumoniae]|nr:divalent metal cation transporter [Klebsiella pneumoniae]VCZ63645.1 hypothetical protein BANRA_00003 [Klebsiella pneumoniae]
MIIAFISHWWERGQTGKPAGRINALIFPAGSLVTALGFISTNASLTGSTVLTLAKRKMEKDDLFNGVMVADTVAHIIGVLLIGAIILVGAIVLFPQGISINTPTQFDLLTPSMGRAAKYIMGIALLGAGFSSLLGNTQRVVLLNSGSINLLRWRESGPVGIHGSAGDCGVNLF